MKIYTKILALQIFLSVLAGSSSEIKAQSILDPSDPVEAYDSTKHFQPPWGVIGKWARKDTLPWNTSAWKCYIYKGYAFRLKFPKTYNPTANDGKKYPMMLFFHGYGEIGPITNNEKHLLLGHQFFQANVDNGNYDGYILSMQSQGFFGVNHYLAQMEIIDYMVANNKLDPFAVVSNGLSSGGQGTWDVMVNHPTRVSAALPMSWNALQYKDPAVIDKVKFSPIWHFQGGLDGNPTPLTSEVVQNAYNDAGGNFKNTLYPNLSHWTWDAAWAEPDFWPFIKRAYASNPWPLFGKKEFFPGEPVHAVLGIAPGFSNYEWRFNGTLISGANSNSITVTQLGKYEARVARNGLWSEWSRIPVELKSKPAPVLPYKVEAENWTGMYGVQSENTTDAGGGKNLGYIDVGDWMEYDFVPPAATTYNLNLRVASPNSNSQLQIRKTDGTVLATVNIPNTGGWQNWQTVSATLLLPAQYQKLRIVSTGGGWNINWLQLSLVSGANQLPVANAGTDQTVTLPQNTAQLNGSGTDPDGTISGYSWTKISGPAGTTFSNAGIANPVVNGLTEGSYTFRLTVTDNLGGTATDDMVVTVNPAGNYVTLPAKIEAEAYVLMSGVQTEPTTDAGGGLNVGYIDNTDWMSYNVNAPVAGTYTLNVRVAAQSAGGQMQIRNASGSVLATLNVPQTGSWQTWQTISVNLSLPAGTQSLKLISTATANWNINWLEFYEAGKAPPASNKIEAENYITMKGVQTEPTSDAGGGLNVGYIDNTDWMDYQVTAGSAGNFTIKLRLAAVSSGGRVEVRKSDGAVLATIIVPQTGGWQNWQTVSATIPLVLGIQTIRLISTAATNWNINWLELTPVTPATAPAMVSMNPVSEVQINRSSLNVFEVHPNPVRDAFRIELDNPYEGNVRIRIIDMTGKLIRQSNMNKLKGRTLMNLSIGDLPEGTYILQAEMKEWRTTKRILKM
jgi:hypothetical protein